MSALSFAQTLRERLIPRGFAVAELVPATDPELVDEEVTLSGGYHVQVGEGDFSVVREEGLVFSYLFSSESLPAVVEWCDANVPRQAAAEA